MFSLAVHFTLVGAGIVAGFMLVLWAIHLLIKNAAMVDVGWAASLGILAVYNASEIGRASCRERVDLEV